MKAAAVNPPSPVPCELAAIELEALASMSTVSALTVPPVIPACAVPPVSTDEIAPLSARKPLNAKDRASAVSDGSIVASMASAASLSTAVVAPSIRALTSRLAALDANERPTSADTATAIAPEFALSQESSFAASCTPIGASTSAPPAIEASVVPSRRFFVTLPLAAMKPAPSAPYARAASAYVVVAATVTAASGVSTFPPPIVALTVPATAFVACEAPAARPPLTAAPAESAVADVVSDASKRTPGAVISAPAPTNATVSLSRSLLVTEPTPAMNPAAVRPTARASTSSAVSASITSSVSGRTVAPR